MVAKKSTSLDVLRRRKTIESLKSRENQFDFKVTQEKFAVLGRKSRSTHGNPTNSAKKAFSRRNATIKKELKYSHKKNTFIQTSENDDTKSSPTDFSSFHNTHNEILTHNGRKLDEIDLAEDDELRLRNNIHFDEVEDHFGGFSEDKDNSESGFLLPPTSISSNVKESVRYMEKVFSKVEEADKEDAFIQEKFKEIEGDWDMVKRELETMQEESLEISHNYADIHRNSEDYDFLVQDLHSHPTIKISNTSNVSNVKKDKNKRINRVGTEKHSLSADRLQNEEKPFEKGLGSMPAIFKPLHGFFNSEFEPFEHSNEFSQLICQDPFHHFSTTFQNFTRNMSDAERSATLNKFLNSNEVIPNLTLKSLLVHIIKFVLLVDVDRSVKILNEIEKFLNLLGRKYPEILYECLLNELNCLSQDISSNLSSNSSQKLAVIKKIILYLRLVERAVFHIALLSKENNHYQLLSGIATIASWILSSISYKTTISFDVGTYICTKICELCPFFIPEIFSYLDSLLKNMEKSKANPAEKYAQVVRIFVKTLHRTKTKRHLIQSFDTKLQKFQEDVNRLKESKKISLCLADSISEEISSVLSEPEWPILKPCIIQQFAYTRPTLFQTYEPIIPSENMTTKRYRDEKKVMKHRIKREYKGAVREIRKDTQFLARQRLKDIYRNDEFKKEKMKEFHKALADEANMTISADEE